VAPCAKLELDPQSTPHSEFENLVELNRLHIGFTTSLPVLAPYRVVESSHWTDDMQDTIATSLSLGF